MAKKPAKSLTDGSDALDAFFAAELKQARAVMGSDDVLVGSADQVFKFGIPIPSLALQYVLQNDIFPMSILTMLAGKPASHKSSFCFELAKWVIANGGYARLFDAEHKYNPELSAGIIGDVTDRQWQYRRPSNIDEWATSLSGDVSLYRKTFKLQEGDKLGTGIPLIPACIIIDSLTGRATADINEKYETKGETNLAQGMQIANAISRWLQVETFKNLPWIVLVVRHEKDGGVATGFSMGQPQSNTPGGKAPDYQGTIDLRFSVIKRERGDADYGYNLVRIKCHKNAIGVDKLQCDVRFGWTWIIDPATGKQKQVPKWEWDLATAQFLAGYELDTGLKDICNVVQGPTVKNPTFSCRQLGVDKVSGEDFGIALRQDSKLMSDLQDHLHIARCTKFSPDIFHKEKLCVAD